MISIVGCFLGFFVITIFSFRNWSIFICTTIAAFVVIFTSNMPIVDSLSNYFFGGMGNYFAAYFGIFLYGGILANIFAASGAAESIAHGVMKVLIRSDASQQKRQIMSLFAAIMIGMIFTFGGILSTVVMLTMFPIVMSIFKEADIPKKYIVGVLLGATNTFVQTTAGTPQPTNVVPMTILGTSSTSGLIPSTIASVIELALILYGLNWMITRSKQRGEHFSEDENKYKKKGDALPNIWVSLVPLVIVFALFNAFQLNIVLCLIIGCICAVIVFWKHLDNAVNAAGEGAKVASLTMATMCPIIGFGTLVQATPGFTSIQDSLLNLNIHPVLIVMISVTLLVFLTGGPATGQQLVLPAIIPTVIGKFGLSPALVHRISAFTACTFDSMPYSGLFIMLNQRADTKIKDTYPAVFFTTVIVTTIGAWIVTGLLILFPGWA